MLNSSMHHCIRNNMLLQQLSEHFLHGDFNTESVFGKEGRKGLQCVTEDE